MQPSSSLNLRRIPGRDCFQPVLFKISISSRLLTVAALVGVAQRLSEPRRGALWAGSGFFNPSALSSGDPGAGQRAHNDARRIRCGTLGPVGLESPQELTQRLAGATGRSGAGSAGRISRGRLGVMVVMMMMAADRLR